MIGLDVGGANLKVASEKGYEIIHFPIWKRLKELGNLLEKIRDRYDSESACVVMTAEISDVFERKVEGVLRISREVERVFREVYYLDVNGEVRDRVDDPKRFMATNWIASCKFLLEEGYRNFVFVDVGSTTTDVIPVGDYVAGKTDLERLMDYELIYMGVLRTPTFHLTDLNVSTEFFSITADVFRVTGDICEEDYNCETPDGRGKSYRECLNRIARLFCSDLEELDEEFLINFAKSVRNRFLDVLKFAILRQKLKGFNTVLGCGMGEFLIREAVRDLKMEYVSIEERFGFSKVFPAYATLMICKRFLGR